MVTEHGDNFLEKLKTTDTENTSAIFIFLEIIY